MQEENDTFRNFLIRTDDLAQRMGINVQNLSDILGIGRATLFCCRTGKRPITGKTWRKLEAAELAAGIGAVKAGIGADAAKTPNQGGNRTIPVLGWAHAGDAGNYDEIPESWQERIPTECRDLKAFAVRLEGDSMEPKFYEGDILILQPGEEIYNGCLAILKMNSEGYIFRRIEIRPDCLRLIPLNPQWGVEEIAKDKIAWAYPVWGMVRKIAK